MKRLFMLVAAMLVAAVPFQAMAAKDSVTIGMRLEPPGLDPTTGAAAAISQITLYNVFETLTRLDNNGAVHPMLASSWDVSDDGKSYTFHLLKGVKFHDGTNLNAHDVKWTFERNGAKDSRNKRKKIYANMTKISVPDAHTVVIKLENRNGLLPFKLAQATASIIGKESAKNNETKPIGSGPYRFVRWTKGDSVDLTLFKGHRDAGSLTIKTVQFRFIKDAAAQVAALLAGDLDYQPGLSAPELFADLSQHPDFVGLKGNTEGETILSINNKSGALADVRVRRAIAHAIDREAVIEAGGSGYGTPIGTHFAPHHPAYVDLTGNSNYDPAKAKALLKEAGHGDGLKLNLKLPPVTYARRGGEVIADQLGKVGIEVEIENVEWAVWLDKVYKNKQYDLSIVSHVEPMDIGIYANPNYYFQYDSKEFQDIMAKADAATNQEEQYKYLQLAQRKLSEDAVNGYLFELAKLGIARKGLTGMWNNWPAFINKVSDLSWQ